MLVNALNTKQTNKNKQIKKISLAGCKLPFFRSRNSGKEKLNFSVVVYDRKNAGNTASSNALAD